MWSSKESKEEKIPDQDITMYVVGFDLTLILTAGLLVNPKKSQTADGVTRQLEIEEGRT